MACCASRSASKAPTRCSPTSARRLPASNLRRWADTPGAQAARRGRLRDGLSCAPLLACATRPKGRANAMKHLTFACCAALAAAALSPAQDPTKAAAEAPAAGQRVGTFDLLRVFDQNPKWSKAKNDLEKLQDSFQAQIKKLSDRAKELRALMDSADEDSDEWRNGRFELEMTIKQRDYISQQASERLELENARARLAVYQDIEAALGQVAKARGVVVVHRMQPIGTAAGELGKLPPKEVQGRVVAFERKHVWYAAPELDLTDDLIKSLMVPAGDDKQPKTGRAQEAAGKPATDKPANDKPSSGTAPAPPKAGG
ncbi:MAG: OmpH family outer membrane protein [Planctomycetes bacterium]|nr:OmpH family outer membrane protein [Planctomycetota bacterium]